MTEWQSDTVIIAIAERVLNSSAAHGDEPKISTLSFFKNNIGRAIFIFSFIFSRYDVVSWRIHLTAVT